MKFLRNIATLVIGAIGAALPMVAANAQTVTGNPGSKTASAGAFVFQRISVNEIGSGLNFGRIIAPTNSSSNSFGVTEDGSPTISGTGNGQHLGGQTRGEFDVDGQPNAGAVVSAAVSSPNGQCNNPSVLLASVASFPQSGIPVKFDPSGDLQVFVGGSLQVGSGATPGVVTCTYTLTVNY